MRQRQVAGVAFNNVKDDLPPEGDVELNYRSLIEALTRLGGEEVCLWLVAGEQSRLQATGILACYDYGWADGIAIGEFVRILLSKRDFVHAHLRTFDGGEHFSVAMRFGGANFAIGDCGLLATDEFDRFP